MVEIKFNHELFDKHIESISKSINKLIDKLDNKDECLLHLAEPKEIKNLLKANTFQMKLYIEFFKINYPQSLKEKEKLNQILRDEVFEKEYNNWSNRKGYGAYTFVQTLDLKTCPYCNRNYTFLVNDETGKLRPEIDHFYPKSIYPFLAMSFFNLIPSCSICNHTKSNIVKENLDNPYDIRNSNYHLLIRFGVCVT